MQRVKITTMDLVADIQGANHIASSNPTTDDEATNVLLNGEAKPFRPINNASKSDESISSDASSMSSTSIASSNSLPKSSSSNETFKLQIAHDSDIWRTISVQPTEQRVMPMRLPDVHNIQFRPYIQSFYDRSFAIDISPNALIRIFRKDLIYIEISLDQAIRINCPMQKMTVNVSSSACAASISHPNGKILQSSSLVDMVAYDGNRRNDFLRYAKMWYKGISFSAKGVPVVYLIDEAGLRTCIDRFIDIENQHTHNIFGKCDRYGGIWLDEAYDLLRTCIHSQLPDGSETIEINNVQIHSTADGILTVHRPNNKCTVRINPHKSGISLTTAYLHCTASLGKTPHLFLRHGDKRVHFDGVTFCVRNGGYSAGFDAQNKVTIFNKQSERSKNSSYARM